MPGTSDAERARKLGVSSQVYSNWMIGKTQNVPGDLVSRLLDEWPHFDANYLFRKHWRMDLAETEKPDPVKQSRARREAGMDPYEAYAEVIQELRQAGLSVKKDDGPAPKTEYLGGVYRMAGEDVIWIDIAVRGVREDRVVLGDLFSGQPKGEKDT